jgi:hypothetical protein
MKISEKEQSRRKKISVSMKLKWMKKHHDKKNKEDNIKSFNRICELCD